MLVACANEISPNQPMNSVIELLSLYPKFHNTNATIIKLSGK
jgi:hypothetical protein